MQTNSSTTQTEITIRGVKVELSWGDYPGGRPGQRSVGKAIHSVSEADMDEGSAGGPYDGERIVVEGKTFELGEHDYETSDGTVTCSTDIYAVEE